MAERLVTSSRGRTFMGWVSPEAIFRGGFNHGEFDMFYKGDTCYIVHLGFIYKDREGDTRNGLHTIIGMAQKDKRRTWYFGTFEGPSWGKMSLEEIIKHREIILDILRHKNRVPAKKLEELILGAVTPQEQNLPNSCR